MKHLRQYIRNLILESIPVNVKVGDIILTGKFKNKRTIVKSIGKDEYGHPTINGKTILKFKIEKQLPIKKRSAMTRQELKKENTSKTILERIRIEDFEDVMQTAELAHMGQTRRDGMPYITHPIAVRSIVQQYYPENFKAQILALLHDAIEDGPKQGLVSEDELRQIIRGSITDPLDLHDIEIALDLMTHDKSTTSYTDYLNVVFSNHLSATVKIADLIHNLSNNPNPEQILKYKHALKSVPPPKYIKTEMIDRLESIIGYHDDSE
jgi:hypothetical protein